MLSDPGLNLDVMHEKLGSKELKEVSILESYLETHHINEVAELL